VVDEIQRRSCSASSACTTSRTRVSSTPRRAGRGSLGADGDGTPWVASCHGYRQRRRRRELLGPEAGDSLSYAAFGDYGSASSSLTCAFTSTTTTRGSPSTCSSSCTRDRLDEAGEVLEGAAQGRSLSPHSRGVAARRQRTGGAATKLWVNSLAHAPIPRVHATAGRSSRRRSRGVELLHQHGRQVIAERREMLARSGAPAHALDPRAAAPRPPPA